MPNMLSVHGPPRVPGIAGLVSLVSARLTLTVTRHGSVGWVQAGQPENRGR